MGNNNIKRAVTICMTLFIFLTFALKSTTVYGAWNNNAIDFVNSYGERNALYKDGAFWFGSWGTANGTIKYRTIGWQISVMVKGQKYVVSSRVGNSTQIVDKRMSGDREYSLWKIDYNTITKKLKAKYPSVDFSELADITVASRYKFDSIMTTGIVSNGNVNLEGDIDDNGNTTWGKVYYDVNGILNAYPWQGSAPDDIRKLFNISATVNGPEKPGFNDEYAPINNRLVVETYDYKESDTVYWIKPNKETQIFVEGYTPTSSMVYPDYNILNLFPSGSNYNYKAYATPNQVSYGTNEFNSQFVINGPKSQAWTNCYAPRNYLHSNFFIQAKYDNKDYKLNYTSQWKNMNRPYTDSGIWLKTDGTPPSISITPNGSGWGTNNLNVKISASDSRSGLDYTKVWVRKNEGAWDYLGTNVTSVQLNGSGIYDISVEAFDKVGNVTPNYVERRFYIDQDLPVIEGQNSYGWTRENVVIEQSAYDSWGSGMNRLELYDSSNTKIASGVDRLRYTVSTEGINNYTVKAFDNVGNMTTKKIQVKIDKTAPDVKDRDKDIIFDYDEGTSIMKVEVKNVIETGSGVDKIWIEYFPKDKPEENRISKELVKNNNTYKVENNLLDLFNGNASEIGMEIWTQDKVGNKQIIGSNEVDIFNITATIERVLAPHEPIFRGGEKGILKIKMYGGVEKVKITFPTQLSDEDSSLNAEFILTPQPYVEKEYEFFIPINAESKDYKVQVVGYKNGREKEVYPSFTVQGSILNQIRTRIRVR